LPHQTSLAEEAADARTRENRLLDWNAMNVYVFGNEYVAEDIRAIEVARDLQNTTVEGVSFVFVNPNEEVPFADEPRVVILDTIQGIQDVALVEGDAIDGLILSPRSSVHDFDLAFQLRYLKKLGKLGKITVIGIPQEGEVDHLLIKSILRKLVAHDMQGS
jgi:Ni,Fe-hydrogenase maturation factor